MPCGVPPLRFPARRVLLPELLLTFRQNHQRRARWSHPLHAGSKPDLGLPWKTQRDAPPEPQHSPRSQITHPPLTLPRSVSDVLTAPYFHEVDLGLVEIVNINDALSTLSAP